VFGAHVWRSDPPRARRLLTSTHCTAGLLPDLPVTRRCFIPAGEAQHGRRFFRITLHAVAVTLAESAGYEVRWKKLTTWRASRCNTKN